MPEQQIVDHFYNYAKIESSGVGGTYAEIHYDHIGKIDLFLSIFLKLKHIFRLKFILDLTPIVIIYIFNLKIAIFWIFFS